MKTQARCALTRCALSMVFATMFAGTAATAMPAPGAALPAAPGTTGLRTDVRAVCPGLDAALQESLAGTWQRIQQPSVLRVTMQIEGDRIVGVSTVGGVYDYRQSVKRAVRALSCNSGSSERQSFAFQVAFADEDQRSAQAEAARGGS